MSAGGRDHGGGIDAASARFGGARADWLDLSTGINPVAYPLPDLDPGDWRQLPDTAAIGQATEAARRFWNVPEDAEILAAPGVSALIARIPALRPPQNVEIRSASYNEHAAAFSAHGWRVGQRPAPSRVIVHPDNPDGALWDGVGAPAGKSGLLVIDESFCDACPKKTHVAKTRDAGTIVLKSFGKFWGLAGVRLGFAIGQAETLAPLVGMLGPWAVSGPALRIGAAALADRDWADTTRQRLRRDAARLDRMVTAAGAACVGGTTLFRLYRLPDAEAFHRHLARAHILTRSFPYADDWVRLGLPGRRADWERLGSALEKWT